MKPDAKFRIDPKEFDILGTLEKQPDDTYASKGPIFRVKVSHVRTEDSTHARVKRRAERLECRSMA